MKRLSLLLALSLIGQSVFGLTIHDWNKKIAAFKAVMSIVNPNSEKASLDAFLKQISELEKELNEVNQNGDDLVTLRFVYNNLMPVLVGEVEVPVKLFQDLTNEEKLAAKTALQTLVAKLKLEVQTKPEVIAQPGLSTFGKAKNVAYNAANTVVNGAIAVGSAVKDSVMNPRVTVTSAGNCIVSGAKAGASYVYNNKKKSAAAVVTVAGLAAAYNKRQALTVEKAKSALSSVKSGIASACTAIKSKWENVVYEPGRVLNARIAMNNGLEKASEVIAANGLVKKASEFAAAHPTAVYRTKVAAGSSAATVASTIAAVKAYNKYKAAKLAAEKAALRVALNLSDDVI